MADYYFHYTSRVAGQIIIANGFIQPGLSGVVYLTDEVFGRGTEAANRLGIPAVGPVMGPASLTKPLEVVCVIPASRLPGIAGVPSGPAAPYVNPVTGALVYLGGAREFLYPNAVNVRGLSWLLLEFD